MERSTTHGKLKRALAGAAAGLCNGLFGAGGGIVAVHALSRLCGLSPREAHATAIGIMLPLSAVGAAVYVFRGGVDYPALLWCMPGVLLGSCLGAKLTGRISSAALEVIFAAATFLAGLWMVLR